MGGFRTPRYHGPLGCLLRKCRAAHGARHTAVTIPLRLCLLGVCFFVRCLMDICMRSCVVFLGLWGRDVVWFGDLQDLPLVRFGVCRPLFFSLVVGMFSGDVFSLSLFLRCWGNPSPFWGLGFPLCFFALDADSVFNPYSKLRTYT